jgi:hypothetical protein
VVANSMYSIPSGLPARVHRSCKTAK